MSCFERVGVIIVNYNGSEHLMRSLGCLRLQTHAPDRCIVIDNDSKVIPLSGNEPWMNGVELIRSATNLGFAAACNLAVREADDVDWIVLLNPDAYPEPNWLAALMRAARNNPGYGSFACRQLDAQYPDRLDGAGDSLTMAGRPFRRGFGQPAESTFLLPDDVFSACGAAALYRRDVFISVGGFDEDFFCYLEDVDLGFRLRLAGYRCKYVPSAVVHHAGSALTGWRSDFSTYHGHRNIVWLYVKNMPGILFWIYLPWHGLATMGAAWRCAARGQGLCFIRSKWDAFRQLPSMFRKRQAIQRTRTTSVFTIRNALTPLV